MASSFGSLVVSLEANIAKFTDEVQKASYIAEREARRTAKAFDDITGSIKNLAAMVGVGLSFAALWSSFKGVIESESALAKWAVRLNTTAEDLNSLGVMMRKTGMDGETFNMALQRMDKNISNAALKAESLAGAVDENGEPLEKGARLMDELGLRAEVLMKLSLPEKLMEISRAMKDNIAPGDQLRVALELAGKSAGGLAIAFKAGPEAMAVWIEKQKALSNITDDMAARGAMAKEAAGDLSTAWHHFAIELTDMVAPAITGTLNLLTELAIAGRKGPPIMAYAAETGMWYSQQHPASEGFGGRGATGSWVDESELRKPPVRPGPKAPGGGGADKSLSGLMNIIDQLEKEYAKFTQGAEAETDAWYQHIINRIKGVQAVLQDPAQAQVKALELAGQVMLERKKRQEEDYQGWLAESYYDTEAKINNDRRKKLQDYLGNAQKQEEVNAVFDLKLAELRSKKESELQGMVKGYYDTLAGLSPLLSTQLGYKQQALDLESKIAAAALEREIIEKRIPPTQADELRGLQAFTNQAKQFNLEREKWAKEGVSGGLKMWAADRQSQMDTRGAQATVDFMKSAETWIGDTGAQAFIDRLHGRKTDLTQMFSDLGDALIKKAFQMGTQGIFDSFAQMMGLSGAAKPTGSPTNPFYVVTMNRALGGDGSLGGLGQKGQDYMSNQDLADWQQVFNRGSEELNQTAQEFDNTFDYGYSALGLNSDTLGQMFEGAQSGLNEVSGGFGSTFEGAINGFASLFGGDFGGGGGGGTMGLVEMVMGLFSAQGNVFSRGHLVPFARGGIVSGPTVFPLGGMGECGPEAIMPLTRLSGGDLGVRAANPAPQINITIETHTKEPVQATVSRGPTERDIHIVIDEMVAKAVSGGGKTTQALKVFSAGPTVR